jgi:hypothetical protein
VIARLLLRKMVSLLVDIVNTRARLCAEVETTVLTVPDSVLLAAAAWMSPKVGASVLVAFLVPGASSREKSTWKIFQSVSYPASMEGGVSKVLGLLLQCFSRFQQMSRTYSTSGISILNTALVPVASLAFNASINIPSAEKVITYAFMDPSAWS